MRRAARTDRNHAEVRDALRLVGCTVLDLSPVGDGCPDLLAGFQGRNVLLEVKDGKKPPSERRLTEAQCVMHASWRGQVCIVTSVDEALKAVGVR